jgi:glycosyltransferase involved in cell wall biosynthesis
VDHSVDATEIDGLWLLQTEWHVPHSRNGRPPDDHDLMTRPRQCVDDLASDVSCGPGDSNRAHRDIHFRASVQEPRQVPLWKGNSTVIMAPNLVAEKQAGVSSVDVETPHVQTTAVEAAHVATVELTVLMPCLNEAETLEVCVRKAQTAMAELGVVGEVVVADNGSTDGSQEIARRLGARVVDIPVKGYGAALLGGIDASLGRFVIMADADDSYALDDLGPFLAQLRAGSSLVMGNRFAGGIEDGAMPALHRYLGNPVLSALGRLFFRLPVGDFHCGMRGFRREDVQRIGLRATGMEFASEMVVKAKLAGLSITEVPTTLSKDGRSRAPHLRTWRDGWRHLRFLLAFSPRWLFLYPGLVLLTLGALGLAWLAPEARTVGGLRLDLQSMLFFAVASVAGLQSVLFWYAGHVIGSELGLVPQGNDERKLRSISLEQGLIASAVFILVGFFGLARSVLQWTADGFGQLDVYDSMRLAIVFVTILFAGLLLFMTSFLVGLVRVQRR